MYTKTNINSICVATLLSILIVFHCVGCSEKQTATSISVDTTVSATPALLVTLPENDSPPEKGAVTANHVPKGAIVDYFFSRNGRSVTFSVRDYGYSYVSINGKPGKIYKADVGRVILSDEGNHVAYAVPDGALWRMVTDGIEGAAFERVGLPQFSPDGRHVAYSALERGRWGLVVDRRWHDIKSAQHGQQLFSNDSTLIAYIDEVGEDYMGRLVVSNLKLKEQRIIVPAGVDNITSTRDKSRVAAIVADSGKHHVISFSFDNPGEVKSGPVYDAISNLVFAPDGVSLAYVAEKGGTRYMVLNDREEVLGDDNLKEPPVVRPDLQGVAAIIDGKGGKSYLHEYFYRDIKTSNKYDGAEHLSYSKVGVPVFAAVNAARKEWFIVAGGKEGPPFDRVISPLFSPDGKYIVYRVRKDGKRFVVVADPRGKTVRQHPAYEQVFEVQFTADGKSVAYGVKDGNKLIWKVEPLYGS